MTSNCLTDRLVDIMTSLRYGWAMSTNPNDLSDLPLSPYLVINLRAMYNEGLPIAERLGAGLSVTANVEHYIAFLALLGRVSDMTWEDIAKPLQITRQTAQARFGHGLPAQALTRAEAETALEEITALVNEAGLGGAVSPLEETKGVQISKPELDRPRSGVPGTCVRRPTLRQGCPLDGPHQPTRRGTWVPPGSESLLLDLGG